MRSISKIKPNQTIRARNDDVRINCDIPEGVKIFIDNGNLEIRGDVAKGVKIVLNDNTLGSQPEGRDFFYKDHVGNIRGKICGSKVTFGPSASMGNLNGLYRIEDGKVYLLRTGQELNLQNLQTLRSWY